MVTRGDFKGRTVGSMDMNAQPALKKLGITFDEALERYGKESFKRKREAESISRATNKQNAVDETGQVKA